MLVLWQNVEDSIEDYLESTGAWTLKPVFAPIKPFEVSLEYTEEAQSGGGYVQKDSVRQNFSLVFTNIDTSYVKEIKLNNLVADLCSMENTLNNTNSNGFIMNSLSNTVTYLDSASSYAVRRNDGVNTDPNVIPVYSSSDGRPVVPALRIPITYLHAIADGNDPFNWFVQKNCFVRGLMMETEQTYIDFMSRYDTVGSTSGSAGDSSVYDSYKPGSIKATVDASEAYKYSCVVTKQYDIEDHDAYDYKFGRVFGKNDEFSLVSLVYNSNNEVRKKINGVIADLIGVDKVDDGYYGGEINTDNDLYYIPETGYNAQDHIKNVVRTQYTGSNPTNSFYADIADRKMSNLFYGLDSGAAGIWFFNPYKSVKVENPGTEIYVRQSFMSQEYNVYLDGPYSGFKYNHNPDNTFGLGLVHGDYPSSENCIGIWDAYYDATNNVMNNRSGALYLGPDGNYEEPITDGSQSQTTMRYFFEHRAIVTFNTEEKDIPEVAYV